MPVFILCTMAKSKFKLIPQAVKAMQRSYVLLGHDYIVESFKDLSDKKET